MDAYFPDGQKDIKWEAQYVKDKEGGWIWGNHREASAQDMVDMQAMVRAHKGVFAYQLSDLVGYHKPISIGEWEGRAAYCRPKTNLSPKEKEVGDAKCGELRDVDFIGRAPRDNKWACNPKVAASSRSTKLRHTSNLHS